MDVIAVGVDGSAGSQAALGWAARVARAHEAAVELVTAVEDTSGQDLDPASPRSTRDTEAWRMAVEVQRVATTRLGAEDVELRGVVEAGGPADVLASRSADLLVVGTRGHGRFASTILGSVARQLARTASHPVAVVPNEDATVPPMRIVVGVDGSPIADHALRWAVQEARAIGATVEVVSTYRLAPSLVGPPLVPPVHHPDPLELHARTTQVVRDALDRVRHDGVTVQWTVSSDRADRCLLGRAQDADLLVVGSRGVSAAEGLMLGSTSQRVLASSPVPVVVVH